MLVCHSLMPGPPPALSTPSASPPHLDSRDGQALCLPFQPVNILESPLETVKYGTLPGSLEELGKGRPQGWGPQERAPAAGGQFGASRLTCWALGAPAGMC